MIVAENIRQTRVELPHVVLTIGSFDGVHLGHQRILQETAASAHAANGTAAVLTMRPHPREFFSPDHPPNLLTNDTKKLELLAQHGADAVFFLPFDEDAAQLEPEAFLTEILLDRCGARELVVGHDFCFGKGARGDFHFLEQQADRLGFAVKQVPPVLIDGERVSSTLVRERILSGDLEGARMLLGRRYSVMGKVLRGRGIGRSLGFPTANIQPYHTAIPAQGVYAAEVLYGDTPRAAAVNIGIAPTIRHDGETIEAHLLDFDTDITGQQLEVIFHHRLRPERKFPSREALVEQIGRDVAAIRAYFDAA